MSLRELAALDCQRIIESPTGFGLSVTVTDPSEAPTLMTGWSKDIALAVDPDTGVVIEGRTSHVNLSVLSLRAANLSIPRNIPDTDKKPWLMTFNDLHGAAHTFKIIASAPDNTLGFVTCRLGVYKS